MGIFQNIRNFVRKEADPITTAQSAQGYTLAADTYRNQKRGLQVYNMSQIAGMTGRDKEGRMLQFGTEQPMFYLTVDQRNQIFKLSSILLGIVSSRMNRISGIDFEIVPKRKVEEKIAEELKDKKMRYLELKTSLELSHLVIKNQMVKDISEVLPDVLPDLSNFDGALLRWKRSLKRNQANTSDEIKEWLMEPIPGMSWQDYIKKVVYNLHVHGCEASYKKSIDWNSANAKTGRFERLEFFDSLPGGSVFKLKTPYFSTEMAYAQVVPSFEPQMFRREEVMYMEYLPTSVQSQSLIPVEALINMISETMLFDGYMAERADGTSEPEKLVIIAQHSPFSNMDNPLPVPLNPAEQKRVETRLNEPRKGKIMTFSGNNVEVVDLSIDSKADTYNARKKDIREEAAMVFNMSNIELNLTGSDDTSGRSTSESQMDMDHSKGVFPHLLNIQRNVTRDLLPYRYGFGWVFEFTESKNEKEEQELNKLKLDNGVYTVNELREKEGQTTFPDEKYNLPKDAPPAEPGADGQNPMFTKSVM